MIVVHALRSAAYALAFYIGSIPLVLSAAIMMPFGPRPVIAITRVWAAFHSFCARWLAGTRVVVEGQVPTGVVIYAVKHETFLETFEILRLLDAPAVVFKAELQRVPVWGRVALAYGVIPVAREAGASALRTMLVAARAAIAAGRSVVIFPEGTRIRHGECPPLRPGIAGLYKVLNLPIVPIAVDSGRIWGWKAFVKRPGVVTFRIGAPIPTGLAREEVEARVHVAINVLNG